MSFAYTGANASGTVGERSRCRSRAHAGTRYGESAVGIRFTIPACCRLRRRRPTTQTLREGSSRRRRREPVALSRPRLENSSLLPIRPIAGQGAARVRVGRSDSDHEVGSPTMYIGGGFVVLVLIIIVVVLLLRR